MKLGCAVTGSLKEKPEFQELLKQYQDKHYNEDYLAQALQAFREKNNLGKDYFPSNSREYATFTRFMKYQFNARQRQRTSSNMTADTLANLYTTLYTLYTPKVLDDRLSLLARDFSNEVDKLEKEDKTGRSRQELIKAQETEHLNGYAVIMNRIFDRYGKEKTVDAMMANYDKKYPAASASERNSALEHAQYVDQEYKKILKHKERLAALASQKIGEEEGFVVNVRNFEVNLEEPTEEELENGQLDNPNSDNDGEDMNEGSAGDRFGDFRTVKLMNTLSTKAKTILRKVAKLDTNGKPIRDDLGSTQYVSVRQAAVVLKKVLVDATPDSLESTLEGAAAFYPWMRSLLNMMESNPDYKTTIYDNFKNSETTYVYTKFENGRYSSHIANSRAADNAMEREAGINMTSGFVINDGTSLYTGHGTLQDHETIKTLHEKFNDLRLQVISDLGAKWICMVNNTVIPTKRIEQVIEEGKKDGLDLSYLRLAPREAMQAYLKDNPSIAKTIAECLQGMGFVVTEQNIIDMALQSMNKKAFSFISTFGDRKARYGQNKLYRLVEWMDKVYTVAEQIYTQNQQSKTGQNLFGSNHELFNYIGRCIGLSQYRELEARCLFGAKSLSTHNDVNLLHQTFDELQNKDGKSEERTKDEQGNERFDSDYDKFLNEAFLRYEGMSLGFGSELRPTGWLKMFRENYKNIRKELCVYNVPDFNGVEYNRLSRAQKLTSSIIQYFSSMKTFTDSYAAVEVPIQSDYETAYDFVLAPRLTMQEVVDGLVDEVKVEIERIHSIQERLKNDSRVKLSVLEKNGVQFQIFPEFNTNNFWQDYKAAEGEDAETEVIRDYVREQLRGVINQDFQTLQDEGVLKHPAMRSIYVGGNSYKSLYSKDGTPAGLPKGAKQIYANAFANIFYSRLQMCKILTGGLEQFNGLTDYEKRNMLIHAPASSLYTNATWKGQKTTWINGREYKNSKETQNVVYVGDEKGASNFVEEISDLLAQLRDAKLISPEQYEIMRDAYKSIKTTDGQGYRTLESFRTVMIMADQWTDRQEDAFKRIVSGKPLSSDIEVFMQQIKPRLSGYEVIPAAAGEHQKPVRLTVLHKYSEVVLLPVALSKYCLQAQSTPLRAFDNVRERMRNYGKDLDLFLFESNVKVGAHSILQPFAKWKDIKGDKKLGETDEQARRARGWNGQDLNERIINSEKDIENYMMDGILKNPFTVHEFPFKYYGIAAPTPIHLVNDKIAWSSQAEKVAWANIQKSTDEEKHEIDVRGKKVDAWKARELYFAQKTADIVEQYTKIREFFNDRDALEKVFLEELEGKSYSSNELKYALAHLADGTFAVPLFSPNVSHQVQQLLSSIIKKRITKPRKKGSNVLQQSGLGMDVEANHFDNANALSEDDKLRIVFEGSGKDRRIKYVEAYIPIYDDRLLEFADENGVINTNRLRWLVDNGYVDERALQFIAYRTPSDAEHSVIPCRVKGFIANTGGAGLILPKEIMVMTGHDYDGDKMRCHFPNFKIQWDRDRIEEFYNERLAELQPGEELPYELKSFDNFFKWYISDRNEEYSKEGYRRLEYIEYDYEKEPLDNEQSARDNARIELMFAELTSPEGSRRMCIPGGCEQSKVLAKSLYLIRTVSDSGIEENNEREKKKNREIKKRMVDSLISSETKNYLNVHPNASEDEVKAKASKTVHDAFANEVNLYNYLTSLSDDELSDAMRAIGSSELAFSLTHATNAYDYIMGGAGMIDVYATQNSAMQMLQRLDLHYIPSLSQQGNAFVVKLFGKEFGREKMFSVKDNEGRLASLSLARLLNAAVDNNKDPFLGYLNQTKELSRMTFFLLANGVTEEQVHLIMNQPVVRELAQRLKGRGRDSFASEVQNLIEELSTDNRLFVDYDSRRGGEWKGLEIVAGMTKKDFIRHLGDTYKTIRRSDDASYQEQQMGILQLFSHLSSSADDLSTFVSLTRPESDSGALSSSVDGIISKTIARSQFRDKVYAWDHKLPGAKEVRISGMWNVLAPRDVHEGWDTHYIESILGTELPEVVALNSLMNDAALDMFVQYFPQARRSWVDLASEIAAMYQYSTVQEGSIRKVMSDMILFKLLEDPKFIRGDRTAEKDRIIIDVPKYLSDLISRVNKEKITPGSDSEVSDLVDNQFLMNFSISEPSADSRPRVRFNINGATVDGISDTIRASWNALMNNDTVIGEYKTPDGKVKKERVCDLAIDLLRYTVHTSGFSYGMYEFAHFAPFSVIQATPGYLEALNRITTSDWDNDEKREIFIDQYCMNHWDDKNFLPHRSPNQLPNPIRESLGLEPLALDKQKYVKPFKDSDRFFVLEEKKVTTMGKEYISYKLYKIISENEIAEAPMTGEKNRSQQMTLYYDTDRSWDQIRVSTAGNNSSWGKRDKELVEGQANYEAEGMPENDANYTESLIRNAGKGFNGKLTVAFMEKIGMIKKQEDHVEKASKADSANEASLKAMMDRELDRDSGVPVIETPEGIQSSTGTNASSSVSGELEGFSSFDAEEAQYYNNSASGTESLFEANLADKLKGKLFSVATFDEEGNPKVEKVPATPNNIALARRQRTYVKLNQRLREILRDKGIAIGSLTKAEALMRLNGVSDFDTAEVVANGFLELIRIAEGYRGEEALPEEFAHVALEMLGHDHPLVKRLLSALQNNQQAMEEAFGGQLNDYENFYGNDREKLALEAAGKLVAKNLFIQQEIKTPVRSLVHRIVDAIKSLFRKFRKEEIQNAIFDANDIASRIAREMLGGKLLDEMSLANINLDGKLYSAQQNLTNKHDIMSRLLKIETKRLAVFRKRAGYNGQKTPSRAMLATEKQVEKLEAAIKNYKTEDAIITYMYDSVQFLEAMDKSLDETIASGRSMNIVCKKLNIVRDTLSSFNSALSAVEDAIVDGEIRDTVGLSNAIATLSKDLGVFHQKYERLAKTYFEEMLSEVYGRDGVTVEIGREKGRHISIKEMARRADGDITMMSHMFNAIADTKDYVLKAFDDIVRSAKMRARRRASEIRPRIEVAIADLEKATGSKDQSFMFEMKRYDGSDWCNGRPDDGKLHKTGKYIDANAAQKLSAPQKKFYDTMMKIKEDADKYLPSSLVTKTPDGKIVMLRKYTMDRFLSAEGAKGKALVAWEGLKGRVMDMSDDIDFEHEEVAKDFEGNKVDMLPVKFLMKGKSESYDDMSDDVATSMMAYAGMAYEFGALNNVIGVLENAKFMAAERDVIQKAGSKTQRESIGLDKEGNPIKGFSNSFREPFTKKQRDTRLQQALEDFLSMHVYGHIRKAEGNISIGPIHTRINKRKLIDTINSVTSLSQMAFNLPQRFANVNTGMTQIMIESLGKGRFTAKDVGWASKIYLKESADRLAETGKTDYSNKLSLWIDKFDVHQNNGRDIPSYKKSRLSRVFNSSLMYAGLQAGEDYLATTTSLALARNFKVKDKNGKEINLWDAYEVRYGSLSSSPIGDAGAYLVLKEGVTKLDGTPITREDEMRFAKLSATMNFEMQGIYNLDDKSAIQQYAFGALFIMYRKWIAPSLKRRYGGVKYNVLKGEYEEGYYHTLFGALGSALVDVKEQASERETVGFLRNVFEDVKAYRAAYLINKKNMTDYERSNLKRAWIELSVVTGLMLLCALATTLPPEPEDDDRSGFTRWWDKTVLSQIFRLRSEIGSQAPTPLLVNEAMKIVRSPFAAIEPLANTLNAYKILLPWNWTSEIKSGRYKGHSKSYKYFRELPVISMFKKVENFVDPTPQLRYYQNDDAVY